MKTLQDYMNDPRIINDPGMAAALEPVREIHAIRLKIQDETTGMTTTEKTAYYRQKAAVLFAGSSTPEIVNYAGQGKLKPRPQATR
jgi:hypothetical protein